MRGQKKGTGASSRNIELKSLKRKGSTHETTKQIKLPTPKETFRVFQQLVKALIKPLLKVLRLEERKIPLKRQKIMLTVFIAWISSQL
ncbi:MAG: hypothetical protein ACO2OY_03470 [Thermodesulfobacteriaceae bacterium]